MHIATQTSRSADVVFKTLTAIICASVVAIAFLFATPFRFIETRWVSESATAFVMAGLWMGVGLWFVRRVKSASLVLFVCGAATAWFLARGIVHSVSPQYGLTSFATACAGACLVWSVFVWRDAEQRKLSVIVPFVTVACMVSFTLSAAEFGVQRRFTLNGIRENVSMAWSDEHNGGATYVWRASNRARLMDSVLYASLETDPGSGDVDSVRLIRVDDLRELRVACDVFAQMSSRMVEREIVQGFTPLFVKRLPVRHPRCASGQVWRQVPKS